MGTYSSTSSACFLPDLKKKIKDFAEKKLEGEKELEGGERERRALPTQCSCPVKQPSDFPEDTGDLGHKTRDRIFPRCTPVALAQCK